MSIQSNNLYKGSGFLIFYIFDYMFL
jgi:hypothetical protein